MFHVHPMYAFHFVLNIIFTISIFQLTFCSSISTQNAFVGDSASNATVTINFFTKTYTASTNTQPNSIQEYYFDNSYTLSINNITSTNGTIYDYCPGLYPASRTQRYLYVCSSLSSGSCPDYETWTSCPFRDTFQYTAINDTFFTARNSSTDGSISFSDYTNVSSMSWILLKLISVLQAIVSRFNLFE